MLINTQGFRIAETAPAAPQRTFLLEGTKDLDTVIPAESRFTEGAGPVYPTLGRRLFPALDALEITMGQLGKHPTPEELDRSNVRRLVRAMLPVLEAYSDCYPKKAYKEAAGELGTLVSAVGQFKDVAVLETTVGTLYPEGVVPPRIAKRLEKTHRQEAELFHDAYKHFRKDGLQTVLDTFSQPRRLEEGSPARIEAEDRRMLGNRALELLEKAENRGLVHEDPEEFHGGRKALRRVLNAVGASADVLAWPKEDVEAMTRLVDGFGVAQDSYIAYEWLEKEGLHAEATRMKAEYDARHQAELQEAQRFLDSGAFGRLRAAAELS